MCKEILGLGGCLAYVVGAFIWVIVIVWIYSTWG